MNYEKMKDFFENSQRKGDKDQGSIKQKNEAKIRLKWLLANPLD